MNPHFHMLVIDGVFSTNADDAAAFTPTRGLPCEPPVLARARAPSLFDEPPPDYDAA